MTAHQKIQRKTLRRTVVGTVAAGAVAVTTGLLMPTTAQASARVPHTGSITAAVQESATVASTSTQVTPVVSSKLRVYHGSYQTRHACQLAGEFFVGVRNSIWIGYVCTPRNQMWDLFTYTD